MGKREQTQAIYGPTFRGQNAGAINNLNQPMNE